MHRSRRGAVAAWLKQRWMKRGLWAAAMYPMACLYGAVASGRRRFLGPTVPCNPVPVLVVGNLTVGGSGKTPLTIWCAETLLASGLPIAVLASGYGGRLGAGPALVSQEGPACLYGDEAVLLAQRLDCPVIAGRNRRAALAMACSLGARLAVSDDGLQHPHWRPDGVLVACHGPRPFGNGLLLPAGPLREPLGCLSEADAILAGGGAIWAFPPQKPVFRFTIAAEPWACPLSGGAPVPLEAWRGQSVHAIAGMHEPKRFFADLRAFGLEVQEHPFADHHAYGAGDLAAMADGVVLCTTKDAVKLRPWADARYHEVRAHVAMDPAASGFLMALAARLLNESARFSCGLE